MNTVSVIVPCRNEIRHVQAFLESLLAQDLGADIDCEFLIADGMSDDGTRQILREWQPRFKAIEILDNEKRFVSNGLNLALRRARGEIVIRMDVHAVYAPDYIRQCVAAILGGHADNVGGPALLQGVTYSERAICLAYQSKFGCGGARFHDAGYEGYVDTVTYGCWRRSTLERIGGFDEEFVRNQDDELNLRLVRQGGKIWQTPKIRSWYRPRSSVRALARQYAQYGYWKTRVIRKHQIPASWRHLVPGAFVLTLILTGISAPFVPTGAHLFVAVLAAYGVASITASILACRTLHNVSLLPVMPLMFGAYHLPYGVGFLRGLYDLALSKKPSAGASVLVR